nr:GDSL-type esterase/lipase family protein [uncultured Blautia sp.]
MNILCFGDSNTYGYKPDGTGRFDENTRWTQILQKKLGSGYRIIEEGLCGRTTVFQDELREGRRGLDLIGVTVEMQNPLDLMILMLGTNDCKTRYGASAAVIARGLDQVIRKARKSSSRPFDILVVSPIHLGKGVGEPDFDPEFNETSEAVSRNLASEYRKVALQNHADFLNAADFASPSATDREHLNEAGHAALAEAIYPKVLSMYSNLLNAI